MSTSENTTSEFDAILCRTNAGVVEAAMREHEAGHRVAVIITGGLKSLQEFAEAADELMQGQRTGFPALAAFENWTEALAYVESDEGADLRPMVKLINKHGTQAIYDVCSRSARVDPRDADVVVVTAHKAKGLEWDRVLIHNDFQPPKDQEDGTPGEVRQDDLRLMYVAVTRARLLLDCSAIAWAF
jgi:ATP-dependent exoDNAse (exonuclease V) beta subunit